MPGPLDGITVLDLTRILAGPFCTMTLGDLGAEIIKIEHPNGGDPARGNGPFVEGYSSYFLSVNRGKRSVTLDLHTSRGADILRRLAEQADVLVENFTPGTMDRFGVGPEDLMRRTPGLIYCSISGFGQTGPYAGLPALDIIVQGMGGIMSITGEPGGPPVRPGTSIGDIAGGLYGAVGVLSALVERAVSGKGQHVDIGMLDCQLAIQENALARFFATGEVPGPIGTRHPIATPFQAFEAADGWVVVAVFGGLNDRWPLFCAVIDRVDLVDDPDYETGWTRTQHYDRLAPVLNEALRARTVDDWVARFREVGIPCGPLNRIDQVAADPQVAARGMIVEAQGPGGVKLKVVASPIKLSRTTLPVPRVSPGLGDDTAWALGSLLGVDDAEIEALRREGVV